MEDVGDDDGLMSSGLTSRWGGWLSCNHPIGVEFRAVFDQLGMWVQCKSQFPKADIPR